MNQLRRVINRTLSVRLSLMVVVAMTFLLMTSLAIMLYFSRQAVKYEAFRKADATLEGAVQHIDNVLLSVEQATGNTYFSMLPYLQQPDRLPTFCRKLVESNPYITGCAIAFKPGYLKEHPYFMSYIHHAFRDGQEVFDDKEIVEELVLNDEYVEQAWFSHPLANALPGWQKPMTGKDADEVPIITFCLPIPGPDGSTPIAVMGVGVTLKHLSSIIEESRTSANSYCMLLDGDGSFIVHPISNELLQGTIFTLTEQEGDSHARRAAKAMVGGKEGHGSFQLDGTDYYIFYKPFYRSTIAGRAMQTMKWSASIVYPKEDIVGDSNKLFVLVFAISIVGMLLLFILCRIIIHRQLKPLLLLADSAQHIAKRDLNEEIPTSSRNDEIGRLQNDFQLMQKTLAANIGELDALKTTLQERNEHLRAAHDHAQQANRLKTVFLHNMTNQMVAPAEAIKNDVSTLNSTTGNEAVLAERIQQNGNAIAKLLKHLINISDEEIRKEATHD